MIKIYLSDGDAAYLRRFAADELDSSPLVRDRAIWTRFLKKLKEARRT